MPSQANTGNSPTLAEALAGLPARVRVHEIARRAGINSKQAIEALAGTGVQVRAASSSVDRDAAEKLLRSLLSPRKGGAKKQPGSGQKSAASTKGGAAGAAGSASGSAAKQARGAKQDSSAEQEAASKQDPGAEQQTTESHGPQSKGSGRKGAAGKGPGSSGEAARLDNAARNSDNAGAAKQEAPKQKAQKQGAAGSGDSGQPSSDAAAEQADDQQAESSGTGRRRRRRGGRGRRGGGAGNSAEARPDDGGEGQDGQADEAATTRGQRQARSTDAAGAKEPGSGHDADKSDGSEAPQQEQHDRSGPEADSDESGSGRRRRRRRRRRSGGGGDGSSHDEQQADSGGSVQSIKGSTRLEAKRQRRRDSRDSRRRPQILSESEFLARRESIDRVMAVRQRDDVTQVALLEDGVLVEHFVSRRGSASMIGNVYLGRVQNVLPSMEAAFVDIGKGRNAVLYAGEVNWDIAGLKGKERRIETALSSGDSVLVQVSKDPVGHKGARLTTQISLPGRFLVYVPEGSATGISRKLPDTERKRLKKILEAIVPSDAGVIIRTAAEGVGEQELAADVARLQEQWEKISAAANESTRSSTAPQQLYAEPDTNIKVVRDLFNSDINRLLIDGDEAWGSLSRYVLDMAPELAERVSRYVGDEDVFAAFRIDEQIAKALARKVRLPSGGSLVIDRTEAMTVVDVNTGKFTGSGGNLEQTVTRNNLEAAEEIVRQLRLRDIGGIIVVDFIDMVLESNRDLVLRRLTECLGRDRTRHQVAEVTSLGLVQMTRKRMGLGLVETFSEPCSHCDGRGLVVHDAPSAGTDDENQDSSRGKGRKTRKRGRQTDDAKFEPLAVDRVTVDEKPDPRGPRPPALFRAEKGDEDPRADSTEPSAAPASDGVAAETSEAPAKAVGRTKAKTARAPEPTRDPEAASEAEPATRPDDAPEVRGAQAQTPAPTRSRRRRAAGRPAGAPNQTAAVEIVVSTPAHE